MGSMIPEGTSTEESERLITETKRLALSILTEYPELHYYQGFHDICFTCLAVLGPDDAFAVLRQIVPKHFSSFMQKTMNATSEMLQLVFDLLKLTSPEIWSRFQALNFEPFFALSWFLTWFTHILSDSNDVHRLYDLFLASDPTMLIYLSVSVIICSTEEISSTSDDFGELHRALTHLPMKHEVERLIQCALDIYQTVGPEKLLQGADERRLGGQASSRSPSPFLLNAINQRLLVCGAVAVVTVGFVWRRFFYSSRHFSFLAMQVHVYLVSILIFGVCCELPQPKTGPGGSSFSLVDCWSDFDLAAFVDVNADRRTDALVWSRTLKKLSALMSPNAKQSTNKPQVQDLLNHTPTNLRSIVVADFNGDSRVDYLFVDHHENLFNISILFGGIEGITTVSQFATEPVICDANADMIADVYELNPNHTRVVLMGTGSTNKAPTGHVTKGTNPTSRDLEVVHTCMNHLDRVDVSTPGSRASGRAVVFAPTVTAARVVSLSKCCHREALVILNKNSKIEVHDDLSPPDTTTGQTSRPRLLDLDDVLKEASKNGHIGKFVFGDFNMSGNIQLLIAGCRSKTCANSSFVYLKSLVGDGDWENVPIEWDPPDVDAVGTWSLAPSPDDEFSRSALVGPSLGDADLDGYPDLAVGLKFHPESGEGAVFPAILRNLRGTAGAGVLDLFLSHSCGESATTSLYVQKLQKEAYFLKVMLTTGRCGSPSDCPGGVLPYGLPGYGFRASYETQGADGSRIHSSAVFVTSACCGALQLPFTIFGFGDFANYVENVPVSIPAPTNETRTHKLTFIVPNAQVVVVPNPIETPSDWQTKLFLEPLYDMKVIYVAITLLVTCVVLIVVVTVLQCLEVRSDQQEKLQESQRFHFDAM
ncbi:unnamed protein product [Mesocestoides corti]|uniref:Rab-GAP TBC domain-containing protein n=1 Tax=Mesocestoides corti TaxID=53468 RepID=A0A158QSH7_MESCO|nr:unnamed protein product [Mesocestoides corti]